MTRPLEYRMRPCTDCPWRRDADLTKFSDGDFAKLKAANGCPGAEAPLGAAAMGCHRDQPGTAHALRLCAGWLAVVGYYSLQIRLHLAAERLPAEAMTAGVDWPELFSDLAEMERQRERGLVRLRDSSAASHVSTPLTS